MRWTTLLLTLAAATPVAAQSKRWVWWEGETPHRTNFSNRSWLSGDQLPDRTLLSGGQWLNHDATRRGKPVFARYRVKVPAKGTYAFWTRKFWKHGPFRWRIDRGAWTTCGRDCALADSVPLKKHVPANWVHLGAVKLKRGTATVEVELLARDGEKAMAAFDAFLLTRDPFAPRGKLKPGQKSGLAEPGFFAFEPGADPFRATPLDLRSRNEKRAGATGFVQRKGAGFAKGDGTPLRFWAVNAGPGIVRLDPGSAARLARSLAKRGVNLVRIHGAVLDGAKPTRADGPYLDRLRGFVEALAREGIYSALSFYFPLWCDARRGYGLTGFTGKRKHPFSLIFFSPRLQRAYYAWAKALLTRGRRPLATNPAVAWVELVNEDSFLFWTFDPKNVPPASLQRLERGFATWLQKKHGSLAGARTAWGGGALPGDRADRMALRGAWHLTGKGHGRGATKARNADQLQFLCETQRAFFEEAIATFRAKYGLKSLVACGNWHTADARVLDPLERWTYQAGDVQDTHGYFGGKHTGPRASYAISVGDRYADRAGVREPAKLPILVNQVAGRPSAISELGWPGPNRYRTEGVPLTAAYGALQGLDAPCWFAVNGPGWNTAPAKFALNVPSVLGQFPAASLMFRRGDVAEAPVVFEQALALPDLYAFKGQAAVTPQNLDALRRVDGASTARGELDPLAFLVGRVQRRYWAKGAITQRDLSQAIRRDEKLVVSQGGALRWDYGRGVVRIDTPRTQGAVGFLEGQRLDLSAVSLQVANPFAAVLVTSLDDQPLARSKRVLVQAMTEERFYGWRTQGDRITSLGGVPLNVRRVKAKVWLTARLKTAQALDGNGYPQGAPRRLVPAARPRGKGSGYRVELAEDALYTVIE